MNQPFLDYQMRLMDEFFSPVKRSQMALPDRAATKDHPAEVIRREVVTKRYNA